MGLLSLSLIGLLALILPVAGIVHEALGAWPSPAISNHRIIESPKGWRAAGISHDAWPRFPKDSYKWLVADSPDSGNSISVKPSKVFQFAYQDYLKGHYELALTQFQKFIQDFPRSSLASEAYFYIGECFEQAGNLKESASAFHKIIEKHENSRQVPAALFKLGNLYMQAGRPEKARTYWKKLITNFRGSPEAKLASQRLSRIP